MRNLYLSILIYLLSGCIGTSLLLYSPLDTEKRHQQNYKGATSISYGASLAEAGAFTINAGSPDGKSIQLGFQVSVKKGSKIRIEKWEIALSSPEFDDEIVVPIESMSLSVYGRDGMQGYNKHIYSGQAFLGQAVNKHVDNIPMDTYITLITLRRNPPKKLTVKMPIFVVKEQPIELMPIVFELIKVRDYGYSMQ